MSADLPARLAEIRDRYPLKKRLLRALTADAARGTAAEVPADVWRSLDTLCADTQALDPAFGAFLTEYVENDAARAYLAAQWRAVQDGIAVQRRAAGNTAHAADTTLVDALRTDVPAFRAVVRDIGARACTARPRVKQLGFGEISAALTLDNRAMPTRIDRGAKKPVDLVYKRMASFASRERAEAHIELYRRYSALLRDGCGLNLPWYGDMLVRLPNGRWRVYATQERLPDGWVGTTALRALSVDGCVALTRRVWQEYAKVWDYNAANPDSPIHVGLDGQITNWVVVGFDPEHPEIRGDEELFYIDTNSPFMLENGKPMLDHHIVTHRSPALLAMLFEPLINPGLAKYHDIRVVMVDYIANCGIQHRPDVQRPVVELANTMARGELARFDIGEITFKEVKKYQRNDVNTYKLMRSLNRIGASVATLSHGRNPHPVQTIRDVYAIVTSPLF